MVFFLIPMIWEAIFPSFLCTLSYPCLCIYVTWEIQKLNILIFILQSILRLHTSTHMCVSGVCAECVYICMCMCACKLNTLEMSHTNKQHYLRYDIRFYHFINAEKTARAYVNVYTHTIKRNKICTTWLV